MEARTYGYNSSASYSSGGNSREYRETTRKKVFKQMLQTQREEVISMDIQIKMLESLLDAVREGKIDNEPCPFSEILNVEQYCLQTIKELERSKEIGIVMLEALKDMRPSHNLDTEENRQFFKKAPTIEVITPVK